MEIFRIMEYVHKYSEGGGKYAKAVGLLGKLAGMVGTASSLEDLGHTAVYAEKGYYKIDEAVDKFFVNYFGKFSLNNAGDKDLLLAKYLTAREGLMDLMDKGVLKFKDRDDWSLSDRDAIDDLRKIIESVKKPKKEDGK